MLSVQVAMQYDRQPAAKTDVQVRFDQWAAGRKVRRKNYHRLAC
jgi:hypothetical protein